MDIRVYSIMFASVFALSSVSSENIQCPQCMHMGYTFTNMPSMYKSIIGGVLASLNLSNPACQYNTLLPDPCPAPGAGNRSKCETFVFKVIGVGFSTALPTAGMTVDVVSRSCAERPVAEPDTCMDVDDMGATNPELGAALARMTSRLNTVNYTGEQCFTSANGSETITPNPTSQRSQTQRKDPQQVLLSRQAPPLFMLPQTPPLLLLPQTLPLLLLPQAPPLPLNLQRCPCRPMLMVALSASISACRPRTCPHSPRK
ncbi:uncharacterized protein LOC128242971 [Mya arenaria]|uniref:uncharacterized protein LOC128242971 n=1 Tax=Mya arenaria TaxID=6604 RepID=UPI0022DF4DA8|nr:uncharacterized protein LOC128242971 [Mya arenaria]